MTPEQQNALALEILSRNDTAMIHGTLGYYVISRSGNANRGVFDSSPLEDDQLAVPLDLPALRKLPHGLSDALLIKAMGRITGICAAPERLERFLMQCLADEKLSPQARLAAGSALTRWSDPNAAKALEAAKDDLNRLSAGAGTKIWETFQLRRQYEKGMAAVRQSRQVHQDGIFAPPPDTPDANQITAAIVAAAGKYDHPMVWAEFNGFIEIPSVFAEKAEQERVNTRSQAAAKALLRVSARLAEQVEPWNTYGDVAYLAEHSLNWDEYWQAERKRRPELIPPDSSELMQVLSKKDYDQFRRNVRAAVAAEEKAAARGEREAQEKGK